MQCLRVDMMEIKHSNLTRAELYVHSTNVCRQNFNIVGCFCWLITVDLDISKNKVVINRGLEFVKQLFPSNLRVELTAMLKGLESALLNGVENLVIYGCSEILLFYINTKISKLTSELLTTAYRENEDLIVSIQNLLSTLSWVQFRFSSNEISGNPTKVKYLVILASQAHNAIKSYFDYCNDHINTVADAECQYTVAPTPSVNKSIRLSSEHAFNSIFPEPALQPWRSDQTIPTSSIAISMATNTCRSVEAIALAVPTTATGKSGNFILGNSKYLLENTRDAIFSAASNKFAYANSPPLAIGETRANSENNPQSRTSDSHNRKYYVLNGSQSSSQESHIAKYDGVNLSNLNEELANSRAHSFGSMAHDAESQCKTEVKVRSLFQGVNTDTNGMDSLHSIPMLSLPLNLSPAIVLHHNLVSSSYIETITAAGIGAVEHSTVHNTDNFPQALMVLRHNKPGGLQLQAEDQELNACNGGLESSSSVTGCSTQGHFSLFSSTSNYTKVVRHYTKKERRNIKRQEKFAQVQIQTSINQLQPQSQPTGTMSVATASIDSDESKNKDSCASLTVGALESKSNLNQKCGQAMSSK